MGCQMSQNDIHDPAQLKGSPDRIYVNWTSYLVPIYVNSMSYILNSMSYILNSMSYILNRMSYILNSMSYLRKYDLVILLVVRGMYVILTHLAPHTRL